MCEPRHKRSKTTLREQFLRALGMPPSEYIVRCRVREGLRRIWADTGTVEAASIVAGYRSCNKFYRRVGRYTATTPAAFRGLDLDVFERLLDDCVR